VVGRDFMTKPFSRSLAQIHCHQFAGITVEICEFMKLRQPLIKQRVMLPAEPPGHTKQGGASFYTAS